MRKSKIKVLGKQMTRATKPKYTVFLPSCGLVLVDKSYLDFFINVDTELREIQVGCRLIETLAEYKALATRIRVGTNERKLIVLYRFESRLSLKLIELIGTSHSPVTVLPKANFLALI